MIGFIRVLLVVEAATFLVASLLHLGALRPLATALGEPVIPQAGIPEGVIGLVLVIGAVAAFSGRVGGWRTFVATQAFALLGTLVGMFALASFLVSPIYLAKFTNGETLGLVAFVAAIVGGFNQVRGAIVGGLLLPGRRASPAHS